MQKPPPRALVALLLTTAAALTGCASGEDTGSAPASAPTGAVSSPASAASRGHNSHDVVFAQMMIPHHQQAVEMSDLLLAAPGVDSEVTDLAAEIKDAQAPEIDLMRDWLRDWGADPSPAPMDHSGMGHGSGDGGMLTEAEMSALGDAEGERAARLYLTGMIEHHRGAVAMAKTQQDKGQDPAATRLAGRIISAQQSEIETMERMLDGR